MLTYLYLRLPALPTPLHAPPHPPLPYSSSCFSSQQYQPCYSFYCFLSYMSLCLLPDSVCSALLHLLSIKCVLKIHSYETPTNIIYTENVHSPCAVSCTLMDKISYLPWITLERTVGTRAPTASRLKLRKQISSMESFNSFLWNPWNTSPSEICCKIVSYWVVQGLALACYCLP